MGSRFAAVVLAVMAVAAAAEGAVARAPIGVLSPVNGDAPTLAHLNPLTLRPAGPRLRLGEFHDAWSVSPDRSQIALGMGGASPTCGRGICIVELGTMRIASYIAAPVAVEAAAWLRPRRIVAVLQRGGIVVADPVTGTIVRRQPLPFNAYAPPSARIPGGGFAVLMDGRPPGLVVTDAEGRVRVAALRRFPGARGAPGLAVDRRGMRAFAVAAGAQVAEVDLRTMRVRYRRVALPRPRRAPPGRVLFTYRDALWLGRGLVAVSGTDQLNRPIGALGVGETFPAGVHLIDTRDWSTRTVQGRAGRALRAAGRLLVYTPDLPTPGVGLRVYSLDGRRLVSHLLGTQGLDVELAGDRAYAYRGTGRSRALHVLRARSGTLIRTVAPPPRGYEIDILDG